MPRPWFFVVAVVVCFSACASLGHRDQDYLRDRGISGSVFEKMRHHEPLTLDEIIALSQRGVSGPFLVHYLRPTYAVYKLSPADMTRLRQARVDEGLIRYLASTPAMFSPASVPLEYQDDPPFAGYHQDYRRY